MNRSSIRLCARGVLAFGLTIGAAYAADEGSPPAGAPIAAPAAEAQTPPDPAAAPATASGAAVVLKGDAVCTKCHDESEPRALLSIYQTRHGVHADARTPTCQGCHGDSDKHVGGGKSSGKASRPSPDIVYKTRTAVFAPTDARKQDDTCIACHRGGKRMHWDGSPHESRDIPCSGCHQLHVKADPVLTKSTQAEACFVCHKTERAQTHRISTHPLDAGLMACSDCHNPHGTTGPKLLAKNSVNDTCFTCHAEKRGPFLWEHQPVSEDCSTCHTPHGSTNAPLLKARPPFLCQECHSGDHGAQVNSGANLQNGALTTVNNINPLANAAARAQLGARACLNCHILVHGSNHPAGAKFQR